MSENKNTTIAQDELVAELVKYYNLTPDQIGFDGEKLEPIFDFDALCTLREKLTDFKCVDVSRVSFNLETKEATATCIIVNAKGQEITVSDFAQFNESLFDGSTIQNSIQAKRIARARAMRSGIRAAGVNLMQAHRHYLETGETLDVSPINPRLNIYAENHKIAAEIGFIVGGDKTEYEKHIAQMFDGRTSSKDLNDIELGQLRISLRAIRRVRQATLTAKAA